MTEETMRRQNVRARILNYALDCKQRGVTARELCELGFGHHGTVSGALSNLHHSGYLDRLETKRDNYRIYVHPDWSPDDLS